MAFVSVQTTVMGFRLAVTPGGVIHGTGVSILPFVKPLKHIEYDRDAGEHVLVNKYYHFDTKNETIYLPKYLLNDFRGYLQRSGLGLTVNELPPVEGADAIFHMLPFVDYKNDIQKNAIDYLTADASGPIRSLALQTGMGKASTLDAKFKTPTGWVRNGDVKLGESLSMPDGTTAAVIGIFPQGEEDAFNIYLEDGRTTGCSGDHLWEISRDASWTTREILTLNEISALPEGTEVRIQIRDPALPGVLDRKLARIEYRGREQTQCIMVDHPAHLYITDDYIVTHNTVSYIWAIQKMAKRSVTTMTSRLEQWVAELQKYTTLDESEIYVIAGLPSLSKLVRQIDKELFPKVILASTATMRLYMEYGPSYQHLPHPSLICETLGIGIWGSDESHESFKTNFMIGVTINPKMFIPITATFTASHPYVKEVMDKFYPKATQFVGGDYDKYVDITAYTYTSGGNHIQPYHYRGKKGYSQQIFEKFLLSRKGKVVLDPLIHTAILPIIKEHYIDVATKGEKLLFLCSSLALCDHLEGILRREYPDKKVSSFYTGKPVQILETFDIILSTPGSAGTGRDVKNLLTCFAFENTQSETRNLQFLGRLRKFPAVAGQPRFIYLSFAAIPQHQTYASARAILYGPRSKSFKHRTIG